MYHRLVVSNWFDFRVSVLLFVFSYLRLVLLMRCIEFWLFRFLIHQLFCCSCWLLRGAERSSKVKESAGEMDRRVNGFFESPPQKRRLTVYCALQVHKCVNGFRSHCIFFVFRAVPLWRRRLFLVLGMTFGIVLFLSLKLCSVALSFVFEIHWLLMLQLFQRVRRPYWTACTSMVAF